MQQSERRSEFSEFSEKRKQMAAELMRDLLEEKRPRLPVEHKTRTSEVRFSEPLKQLMRDLLEEKRPRLLLEHRTSEVRFSEPLKQLMKDLLEEKRPRLPVEYRTSEVRFSEPLKQLMRDLLEEKRPRLLLEHGTSDPLNIACNSRYYLVSQSRGSEGVALEMNKNVWTSCLHQVSELTLQQLYNDARNSVLIENNDCSRMGLQPIFRQLDCFQLE